MQKISAPGLCWRC